MYQVVKQNKMTAASVSLYVPVNLNSQQHTNCRGSPLTKNGNPLCDDHMQGGGGCWGVRWAFGVEIDAKLMELVWNDAVVGQITLIYFALSLLLLDWEFNFVL